jgi:hypothetical protein
MSECKLPGGRDSADRRENYVWSPGPHFHINFYLCPPCQAKQALAPHNPPEVSLLGGVNELPLAPRWRAAAPHHQARIKSLSDKLRRADSPLSFCQVTLPTHPQDWYPCTEYFYSTYPEPFTRLMLTDLGGGHVPGNCFSVQWSQRSGFACDEGNTT